jgi:hypothetical protein
MTINEIVEREIAGAYNAHGVFRAHVYGRAVAKAVVEELEARIKARFHPPHEYYVEQVMIGEKWVLEEIRALVADEKEPK